MNVIKDESNYNMIDWWKKVVLDNYANFEGRARRSEYWYFILVQILLTLSLLILGFITVGIFESEMLSVVFIALYVFISLGFLIPSLAVAVRRLHDTGKSGWFYLINFIPLGGIVLIIFYCQESEPGTNKWGPNPKIENIDNIL